MKCSTRLAISEIMQLLTFQLRYVKRLFISLCIVFVFDSSIAQNVGIGIDAPTQKLDVGGNIKGLNILSTGFVGIGTMTPIYKLHVIDGSLGLTNSADNVTWLIQYSSSGNGLNFYNGGSRLALHNSGNVGIGVNAPTYKLDVNGNIHAETNAVIDGSVTVNNGKGIMQNSHGSGQLKYYTRTATFTFTNFPGFALSSEQAIGFQPGVFSSPPKVFVGDIVSTGGTLGELYRLQLVIYEVTTTGCKVRVMNTSPNPISYSTTWNIVCLGE